MPKMKNQGTCLIESCGNEVNSRGLCRAHYLKAWRDGRYRKTRLPVLCFVKDCAVIADRQGMCRSHYAWIRQAHRLATNEDYRAARTRASIQWTKNHPELQDTRNRAAVKSQRVTRWYRYLASHCTTEAKRAGYVCDFNADYILGLYEKQKGRCYWLGIPMLTSLVSRDPRRPSVDKLDPSKGYTRDNVVLTCMFANMGRNSFPANDFAEFVAQLRATMPR